MKRSPIILSILIALLSYSAHVWGDDFGALNTNKSLNLKALSKKLEFQSNPQAVQVQTLKVMNSEEFRAKVTEDLRTDFDSTKYIQALGPGVTGGGDSCEQKIAYSFVFLADLVKKERINLSAYGKTSNQILAIMDQVQLRFGQNLKVDRPVEAINVPRANVIILDRKICQNNFEPLYYYTPLMLHEVLRLAGIEDGRNYMVSGSFIPTIQGEIRKVLNEGRQFRVFSKGISDGVALAWGLRDSQVDFEMLDAMSDEEQWKFFDDHADKIENYIVDLKTMKILLVARSGDKDAVESPMGPVIELKNMINTNHNDLSMSYDSTNQVGLVQAQGKWMGGATRLFATKLDNLGHLQVTGTCDQECERKIIFPAMRAQMTASQLQDYDRFDAQSTFYELTNDENGSAVWKVLAYSQNPKQDGTAYQGFMRLTFKNGQFVATFSKMTMINM